MFTNSRDSTRLYRKIGNASAFGRVREHFDVLEQAIAFEGGERVFAEEINNDPEVQQFLAENIKLVALCPFTGNVKGFDGPFTVWKLKV